ncbi:MAG: peptidase C45 [Acidobacteria bacterium]|nr:peptidase C45 [Acidobacteriota bacterium]
MRRRALVFGWLPAGAAARATSKDPRLKNAFRRPEKNGWTFVRLAGAPREIGFQHGNLLAPEIQDAFRVIAYNLTSEGKKEWPFFREAAEKTFWPRVEDEYRQELEGIVEGLNAKGAKLDLWDLVAYNAALEFSPNYLNWFNRKQNPSAALRLSTADRCSAFVATGSYTRDGRIVIGHNNWTGYADGARWSMIFEISPAKGYRILMDGLPGYIHSGDDFGMNSAGIAITETTITQFDGFDPGGIPEFARARKAMQYANSIDEFARLMREGNNGAYANNWLVADRNSGEIASLELGLKNVELRRTKDGYLSGANFPVSEKLAREETDFPMNDAGASANARRIRWDQLMAEHKGRIDVAAGQRFLSDHYDTFQNKVEPNERTLCGHVDLSPRGLGRWQPPFGMAGTVQAKVADAAMVERLSLTACMGHPCGLHFRAADHLRRYPRFNASKPYLRNLPSRGWTDFGPDTK